MALLERDEGDETPTYDMDRLDRMRERYASGEYSPEALKQREFAHRMATLKAAVDAGFYHEDPDSGQPLAPPDTSLLEPDQAAPPDPDSGDLSESLQQSLLSRWWMPRRGR